MFQQNKNFRRAEKSCNDKTITVTVMKTWEKVEILMKMVKNIVFSQKYVLLKQHQQVHNYDFQEIQLS